MMLHPQRRYGIGQTCDPTQDLSCAASLTDASFSSLPVGGSSAGTAAPDVGAGANVTSQLNLTALLNSIIPMQSNMAPTTAPGQQSATSATMNNYLIIALIAFGAVVVLKGRR